MILDKTFDGKIIKLCDDIVKGNNYKELYKECTNALLSHQDSDTTNLYNMITSLVENSHYKTDIQLLNESKNITELSSMLCGTSKNVYESYTSITFGNDSYNRILEFNSFTDTFAASQYLTSRHIPHDTNGNNIYMKDGYSDKARECLSYISSSLNLIYSDIDGGDTIEDDEDDEYLLEILGTGTTKPLSNKSHKTFQNKDYVKNGSYDNGKDGFSYTINVHGKANFEIGYDKDGKYILAGGSKYVLRDLEFAKLAEMFNNVSNKSYNRVVV